VSSESALVGIDVGGGTIKAASFAADGTALDRVRVPTPSADSLVATVADIVNGFRSVLDVQRVGLAVPGLVDDAAGISVRPVNLDWEGVAVGELVEERCGVPVTLMHDVRAAAVAEHRRGAGAGLDDLVYVALGTGIGAALISDGRLLVRHGYAGEIGHVDVGHGEPCTCGARGCLEAIASAGAISRRFAARSGQQVAGAREVAAELAAGNEDAAAVWAEAVAALAYAFAWVVSILAPERIVLGGGLSLAGPALIEPLDDALRSRLTIQSMPELRAAAFGDESGCLGAALLAHEPIER
jgi:glucokinase